MGVSNTIAKKFINDLRLAHLPEDEWFVVPTENMNPNEYRQYSTDRLLSSMLSENSAIIDGAEFEALLLSGMEKHQNKVDFLKERYNLQVVKLRNKVVCINFRLDADTHEANERIHGPVPHFCEEPISMTRDAFKKKGLTKDIVRDFIEQLKAHSQPNEYYLFPSANDAVAKNQKYRDISRSPRMLSNMIGMDPAIFASDILEEKGHRVKIAAFLQSKYGAMAVTYKNVFWHINGS